MGVADILAMAFMFALLILGAVLMHAYSLRPLQAATDRQLELKCEHIYKALETAWVEPYTVSFLRAAAENLVLDHPTVPGPYLRSVMENALGYLSPPGFEISVALTNDEGALTFHENVGHPSREFVRRGSISVTKAGGENVVVQVVIRLFSFS